MEVSPMTTAEALTTTRLVRAEAPPSRTLAVTAAGTALVLASFSVTPATVIDTARSLHAGVAGQTWALSGMSLGLATALLAVGALADDFGRRRVLVWSAGVLALTAAVAAVAPSID